MSYTKKPIISLEEYYKDMVYLSDHINGNDFSGIVCLKRSGWILGTLLSNQKTLPLFTESEIKSKYTEKLLFPHITFNFF